MITSHRVATWLELVDADGRRRLELDEHDPRRAEREAANVAVERQWTDDGGELLLTLARPCC